MDGTAPAGKPQGNWAKRGLGVVGVLAVLAGLYYAGGALWLHEIDDDPGFAQDVEVPENGSRAVAVAAALIDREVNVHRWVANDPWFQPAAILDNMPNFQAGIVAALSRFAIELTDQIARARGTSQVDPDADSAAGRLKYPGDVWIFEWSSTPVQPSSESQYRKAIEDLRRYNERLAAGNANFERRSDNLMATLERIAADIGGSSAALSQRIEDYGDAWIDPAADDLFYATKGRLYAYYLLLEALGIDYAGVLGERNVQRNWDEMLASLRAAAALAPWVVANGELDGQTVPNHLAAQGFLLLRARFQLYEVINILLK
ncbi:DUF2333 family protein [Marinimicrococcus flavescens]|uniref:DUF2333 family protein n=1 Tax=Marinimicrococcus flavescens TaxID=3031815 RepID=A0AAP3UYY5_9PROT|nr:DUF2333 family protein [Marinimicrococcus flavescens]